MWYWKREYIQGDDRVDDRRSNSRENILKDSRRKGSYDLWKKKRTPYKLTDMPQSSIEVSPEEETVKFFGPSRVKPEAKDIPLTPDSTTYTA